MSGSRPLALLCRRVARWTHPLPFSLMLMSLASHCGSGESGNPPANDSGVVNGNVVHSEAKTGPLAKTDGIYGIRVNHLLDVQIDNFGVSK